jgi:cation:H+ antiporter
MTGTTVTFQLLFVLISLGVLYVGAEALIRGAASIALRLGLTPLVVGLTIVAYGTSTPELFVGVHAALETKGDIVIGNVVGANILNIALMLGVAALIRPQKLKLSLVYLDVPIVALAYLAFVLIIWDSRVSRWEGAILFIGFLAYTAFNVVQARREKSREIREEFQEGIPTVKGRASLVVALIVAGFFLLALGSDLLIDNAVALARTLGVSEAVIALTIIAFGTTSAELTTAVVASSKNEPDLVFGNSIGSCVYNILCIVGVSAMVAPIEAPGISAIDLGMMVLILLVLLPMMRTGLVLSRWEGAVLLGLYSIYLAHLWPA